MRFFLLLLFFTTLHTYGQVTYRFKNFSISDGLSQSSVLTLVQDDSYSFWIGTQDGLNRFDGKHFYTFNPDNTPSLKNTYVKKAIRSSNGHLWFATNNGLIDYNQELESFTSYVYSQNETVQVEDLIEDPTGRIWIASSSHGLLYFDKYKKKISVYKHQLPTRRLYDLFIDQQGTLYLSTEDKGLFSMTQDGKVQSIKAQKSVENLTINKIKQWENHLIVLTNNGIFEIGQTLEPLFVKTFKQEGDINFSDIHTLADGSILFATKNKGLYTLKNGQLTLQQEDDLQKNKLIYNDINFIFEDEVGNIWLGTERGLSFFNPKMDGFLGVGKSSSPEMGLPSSNVWAIDEDLQANYLYLGTDLGVTRFNRSTNKYEQFYRVKEYFYNSNPTYTVLSLKVIRDNLLLVGSIDGFYELNIESKNKYNFKKINIPEHEGKAVRYYTIVHWKDTKYLVGCTFGVFIYDLKTKKIIHFKHDPKNPTKTITPGLCKSILKDNNQKIWLSTTAGGLNEFYEHKQEIGIRPIKNNAKITSVFKDYITCITQINPNTYALGSLGSGMLIFNPKTGYTQLYTRKNGLSNNVVYGILKEDMNSLWLSTNQGICNLKLDEQKIACFTESDGLLSNEFNIGAYFKSKNGTFYFGGILGFNFFNPERINQTNKDFNIQFTQFKLDKNWLKPNEKGSPLMSTLSKLATLNLTYKQRSFTLKFQPSNLALNEQLNYKYQLVGSDEGEINIGNDNELHFNSLSPGEYTLKIYARVGQGKWMKTPAVLNINIAAPFWQRWWFWSIIALIIVLFIRVFIKMRISASKREQVLLEMKIVERTKEIRDQNKKIEEQNMALASERNKVLEQQRLLQIEKDKSEKLIKNLIPESTAEELKNKGTASARAYKMVSVLFTDFVGFTKIAEKMNPSELVQKLDFYFKAFDEIILRHNLEKIKTIGDAYMCAGGVPVRNKTNPIDTVLAALEIQRFMLQLEDEAKANGEDFWELRLGINTGEVTAGVIGSNRLAYDIWGSTVNQAQRMEMMGKPGIVNISGATYHLIEPYFQCTFRGMAPSKSKGEIEMYSVDQIKPELSVNGEGLIPNERFYEIVNLYLYSSINYQNAEAHIMRVLKQGLSESLYYHCIEHTLDVVGAVERIALSEGVTNEDLFLLKSAATYHDAGFVECYDKNEPIGAKMAEEILPNYGYNQAHIDRIKELIFVTEIPHQPKNLLEQIICDADLDYLGRDDFHEIADRLRRELREHGKINSDRKWDEMQVAFLTAHQYFTTTSIQSRQLKKQQNLAEIKERLAKDEYKD